MLISCFQSDIIDFDELKKEKAKQSQYGYIESAILLNTGAAGQCGGVTRLCFINMFEMFREANLNHQQETDRSEYRGSQSDRPEQDPR